MDGSVFAALEGLDGTGKTTVLPIVAQRLRQAGLSVQVKPEFPEGDLDNEFREALQHGLFLSEHLSIAPQASFFYLLYAEALSLARCDFQEHDVVLADRSIYTHSMYQAYFSSNPRGNFDAHSVKNILKTLYVMFGIRLPDHIFILDAPIAVVLERLERREARHMTASENATLKIFGTIYKSFESERTATMVDALQPPEQMATEIAEAIVAMRQAESHSL